MSEGLVGFITIFLLRLGDVPIGTVRTMLMVQGRRFPVAMLAFVESAIWILAISRVLGSGALNDPAKMAGYALGFATGTVVGMTIERWLAFGKVLVRVISRTHSEPLRNRLFDDGYGVTAITGEGRAGSVLVLFVVAPRRRLNTILRVVRDLDPHAFITHEPVSEAIGGYLPTASEPAGMKK
jgi:uncharacterized protein YebE (UPF0316 family)